MIRKYEQYNDKHVYYLSELRKIGQSSKIREEKKSCIQYALKELDEYCFQSAIHGLKYIRDKSLSKSHKTFWYGVFVFSVILSIKVVIDMLVEWKAKSFLMIYDSHLTSIWEIPFPSVTICTHFMIKKSFLKDNNVNNSILKLYSKLACAWDPGSDNLTEKQGIKYTLEDLYTFIPQVTPSCSEIFRKCKFKNRVLDCCTIFEPIMTEMGFCFVFNHVPLYLMYKHKTNIFNQSSVPKNVVYWSPDEGYPILNDQEMNGSYMLPHRTELAGEIGGLNIELVQNMKDYQLTCSGGRTGFHVKINSPIDMPTISSSSTEVPAETETTVILSPTTIVTSRNLEQFPPASRRCYYQHEKSLTYFNYYTRINCLVDCYDSTTFKYCQCSTLFLPRNISTAMCIDSNRTCQPINQDTFDTETLIADYNCGCFSPCSEVVYHINSYSSDLITRESKPPWDPDYTANRSEEKLPSRLRVYFKRQGFTGKHREIQMSLYDFLGSCGGLLGLVLGFSFISTFELIYFLVIRLLGQLIHKTAIN